MVRLIWMPTIDPSEQRQKQSVIDVSKGPFRYDMTVVIGPANNLAIECPNHVLRLCRFVGFDKLSDITQERLYRCLGGLNE